ncbi:hypothetical protein ANANG_G00236270, partial [Anguilla anguilla]
PESGDHPGGRGPWLHACRCVGEPWTGSSVVPGLRVLRLWKETKVPGGNPCKHGKHASSTQRGSRRLNPEPIVLFDLWFFFLLFYILYHFFCFNKIQ